MASANVTFSYEGPAGTLLVNWWITTAGGKPAALGGNGATEVAYRQGAIGVLSSGAYTPKATLIGLDPSVFPDGLSGQYDCWVAVYYQQAGVPAVRLGFASFPGAYFV